MNAVESDKANSCRRIATTERAFPLLSEVGSGRWGRQTRAYESPGNGGTKAGLEEEYFTVVHKINTVALHRSSKCLCERVLHQGTKGTPNKKNQEEGQQYKQSFLAPHPPASSKKQANRGAAQLGASSLCRLADDWFKTHWATNIIQIRQSKWTQFIS